MTHLILSSDLAICLTMSIKEVGGQGPCRPDKTDDPDVGKIDIFQQEHQD